MNGTAAHATQVIRHSSELGRWEAFLRPPHPRLASCVEGPYQGWCESLTGFSRRLEAAFPGVVLILNFAARYQVVDPRAPQADDFGSFVAGLYDSYVLVESHGEARGIQINLTPIGAHRLLRIPMEAVTNRTVHLDDLFGPLARQLVDRLQETPTWEARFDLLDDFLLARLETSHPASTGVVWAWEQLRAAGGCLEIGALATELGWSRRHLIARFREAIGLPPKTVARILRFHRAVGRIGGASEVRWAEIACDCGYYDQAHLIRDFGEFAGATPTEYLRRILPDGGGVIGD